MAYPGDEEANPERVRRYLRENYTDPDGTPLSDARLTELMTDHAEHMTAGSRFGSYAHFLGDQIADAADLLATDEEQ